MFKNIGKALLGLVVLGTLSFSLPAKADGWDWWDHDRGDHDWWHHGRHHDDWWWHHGRHHDDHHHDRHHDDHHHHHHH
jgi:hypothetical protein